MECIDFSLGTPLSHVLGLIEIWLGEILVFVLGGKSVYLEKKKGVIDYLHITSHQLYRLPSNRIAASLAFPVVWLNMNSFLMGTILFG